MTDIIILLDKLEAELRQQQLWSQQAPDTAALASTMPFCCDTLALEQWLQFIFLPRMRALLQRGAALPNKVAILPMAEEAFKPYPQPLTTLLDIISQLDSSLTRQA